MPKEQAFWKWFLRHEDDLLDFERDREAVFDALAAELQRVNPDLTFEFGPKEGGSREFVISAAGIKGAFPAVESLAGAAPKLKRWKVTAFRPRRPVGNIIEFGNRRIDPEEFEYSLLQGNNELGLYLFIPGCSESNPELHEIGYLFLDEALGEYDVEMKLGLIKMFPPEAEIPGPRYPLRDLPGHFDEAFAEIRGREQTDKPTK
jgi:hypothetical protein